MKKYLPWLVMLLTLLGLMDSIYLLSKHYQPESVVCPVSILIDCGEVLKSEYSEIAGIPLALLGVIHYGLFSFFVSLGLIGKKPVFRLLLPYFPLAGAAISLYLMWLQVGVIGSICLYCTASALISFLLLIIFVRLFTNDVRYFFIKLVRLFYLLVVKNLLFLIDAEVVHDLTTKLARLVGKVGFFRWGLGWVFNEQAPILAQKYLGIEFNSPVGLAAGFDYDANLTQILPSLGFGFMTVGTITNGFYEGNPKPRLGRLLKSKSLMVNKGFKSQGADKISQKLEKLVFQYPVGISIGRTNSSELDTRQKSVNDIVTAFKKFEDKKVKNAYFELNISCPNLIHEGKVVFDQPQALEKLLSAVDGLKLKKLVFIKMPIDKTDKQVLALLKVIVKHNIKGVIFGNLQKDRNHPRLVKNEVAKFKKGYFSGRPTFERSNELIALCYKKFGDRLLIIGCGGIFNARDAYTKIKLGAGLVQLITGLVYQGPQLVAEINHELPYLLAKDGFKSIKEAVGSEL